MLHKLGAPVEPSIEKARAAIRKRFGNGISVDAYRSSILLAGSVPDWDIRCEAGWAAALFGFKGVVNDIAVPGIEPDALVAPSLRDTTLEGAAFDVAIIGGGVIGTAIARELSRWNVSTVLLEREYDVAVHTSSRNDGMIHDGFAAKPGSLKALYNVRGNRLWEPLCAELGIEFKRPGSLVLFRNALSAAAMPLMAMRARKNRIDGWEFWGRRRVAAEEPNVTPEQHGALFLPSAGVLSPYRATVALAENAATNGVRLSFFTCVTGMDLEASAVSRIHTNRGTFRAVAVVNAAGNWADVVAAMADDRFFSLHQRRGAELILDKSIGDTQHRVLGMPNLLQVKSRTKGGGLVPTVEGNILVGPTAREAPGREDYATEAGEMAELEQHLRLNTKLTMSKVITYFAGVRACTWEEDFIIERSERVTNLVHAAGIQSPGLASAPAIAVDVARMALAIVGAAKQVRPKADWKPHRVATPEPKRLPLDERARLIAADPAYGRIVCRCEEVSEGEIRDVLRSPLSVSSVDGVKRRARAGMGRCHGGFCTPRVMEIIASETGLPLAGVSKKGPGSAMVAGVTKAGSAPGSGDTSSGGSLAAVHGRGGR